VRVGSFIVTPHKVRDVPPVYPPAAIAAKVEGVVIVEANIDVTGRVTKARVLQSIPLLDEAALVAVRQWEFEPVVIDGIGKVPFIAALTVSFKLP
jgi:protein TonB